MPVDFTGTWENQHKSKLELTVLGDIVSGRFESGVGDNGETLWVQISGRVLDDVLTFNAVYPKYGTIVSWVGQHTTLNGTGVIMTHWLHATNIEDTQEPEWMWKTNRIGSDQFKRV